MSDTDSCASGRRVSSRKRVVPRKVIEAMADSPTVFAKKSIKFSHNSHPAAAPLGAVKEDDSKEREDHSSSLSEFSSSSDFCVQVIMKVQKREWPIA